MPTFNYLQGTSIFVFYNLSVIYCLLENKLFDLPQKDAEKHFFCNHNSNVRVFHIATIMDYFNFLNLALLIKLLY